MAEDAVVVEHLRKIYDTVIAVNDVSFRVPRGEICGYLGPNGAGKSTTTKILTGLVKKTTGAAAICGVSIDDDPLEAKRRIGYVPESGALYEMLTPVEYLTFIGSLYGIPEREAGRKIERFLDIFQLKSEANERMSGFSKGMKQKIVVAAALIHDPEVIFLDEPFSGLDANSVYMLKEVVKELAKSGKTIFLCSHILDLVERVCDRVIIIDKGKIVADGELAAMKGKTDASLEEIFRELTSEANLSGLAQDLIRAIREKL